MELRQNVREKEISSVTFVMDRLEIQQSMAGAFKALVDRKSFRGAEAPLEGLLVFCAAERGARLVRKNNVRTCQRVIVEINTEAHLSAELDEGTTSRLAAH